jgi:DNA transformation protein
MNTARPLPEFTAHCMDLLASIGPCKAKRMFGGWGLSVDGITFGIIANLGSGERLWLKTNDQTLARFRAEGCPRFVYQAKGREMALHYHAAPEAAMESPALMRDWAHLAWQAALAAQARPQPQQKPRP